MINRTEYIQQYLDRGYSLIPLANNSKKPPKGFKWLQYQNQKASFEDIFKWDTEYNKPNIAIVTGRISKLVVIDVDDPLLLPELFKLLPEANITTRVKTARGYHFYFSSNENEIRTTNNFLKLGIELKYKTYVVACPSVINDHTYTFEIPLLKMLPFPVIVEKDIPKKAVEYKQVLRYRNKKKLSCIFQILSRNLQEGERTNSLFLLYILLNNENTPEHSQKVVISKNNSLIKPLTEKELVENIFKKVYKYKCSNVREKLPYINCESCFKFKGGVKVGNIIIHNLRNLENLSGSEQRVLLFKGTYFEGENPSVYELSQKIGMRLDTTRTAVEGLIKKGIISE